MASSSSKSCNAFPFGSLPAAAVFLCDGLGAFAASAVAVPVVSPASQLSTVTPFNTASASAFWSWAMYFLAPSNEDLLTPAAFAADAERTRLDKGIPTGPGETAAAAGTPCPSGTTPVFAGPAALSPAARATGEVLSPFMALRARALIRRASSLFAERRCFGTTSIVSRGASSCAYPYFLRAARNARHAIRLEPSAFY